MDELHVKMKIQRKNKLFLIYRLEARIVVF